MNTNDMKLKKFDATGAVKITALVGVRTPANNINDSITESTKMGEQKVIII